MILEVRFSPQVTFGCVKMMTKITQECGSLSQDGSGKMGSCLLWEKEGKPQINVRFLNHETLNVIPSSYP